MGDALEDVYRHLRILDASPALVALAQMGAERGDAKAHLVIEEEIDLVGKQVPMVHGVSGDAIRR
jgi:hypothetical protein